VKYVTLSRRPRLTADKMNFVIKIYRLQVIVFLTDQLSYESFKDHTDTFKIGRAYVKVLNRKKLIELKQSITPVRSKDLFDIEELSKLQD
jgi:hypothetical protein